MKDDSLYVAQAVVRPSYYPLSSVKLRNTTWLYLTLSYAYATGPPQHIQHIGVQFAKSVWKRRWWCIPLGDRVITLGMWRPLQSILLSSKTCHQNH